MDLINDKTKKLRQIKADVEPDFKLCLNSYKELRISFSRAF